MPNTNGSLIWNNFQDQTFTAKVAISPKNIGKMPQNLLKKIFWKINFIKMLEIFICELPLSTALFQTSRIWLENCTRGIYFHRKLKLFRDALKNLQNFSKIIIKNFRNYG